ncbi:MAG: serine hydrolase domain-containing protein [Acidobacteriota bacterium]
MKNLQSKVIILLFIAFLIHPLEAQGLPTADPGQVGLSDERLDRISKLIQQYVDDGKVSGVVTLVARDGKVAYFKSFGKLSRENGRAMPADAIFRIASMSKAVTTVAVMTLVEEGKIQLGDRLSRFIPEFKETTVAVPEGEGDSKQYKVVPAQREITIRDLLTHTAGISYGSGPAEERYKSANLQGWYFADRQEPIGESIKRLARLPFDAQPGEKWVYGYNTDILGYVVERVSGMTLAEFFRQRIFEPLKMVDTHFYLPAQKVSRFTPVYAVEDDGLRLAEAPETSDYVTGPRRSYSGGAGLLSTTTDYARFLQMLLNGGELEGARILSPKSVQLMTVNHVGDKFGNLGFGLGFRVIEDLGRAGQYGSAGAYGWGGAYYTSFWVDPQERLIFVFMSQLLPSRGLDLRGKFNSLVYQSILDSYVR